MVGMERPPAAAPVATMVAGAVEAPVEALKVVRVGSTAEFVEEAVVEVAA